MGRQLTLTSALRWLQDNRYHVDKVSLRYAFVEWLPELVPDRWVLPDPIRTAVAGRLASIASPVPDVSEPPLS